MQESLGPLEGKSITKEGLNGSTASINFDQGGFLRINATGPAYETDENGNLVVDENQQVIPIYLKDENGNYILDGNGDKVVAPISSIQIQVDENGVDILCLKQAGIYCNLNISHNNGVRGFERYNTVNAIGSYTIKPSRIREIYKFSALGGNFTVNADLSEAYQSGDEVFLCFTNNSSTVARTVTLGTGFALNGGGTLPNYIIQPNSALIIKGYFNGQVVANKKALLV